jgi:hypothetical protein
VIRTQARRWVPPWLSERITQGSTVGWRVIWAAAVIADAAAQQAFEALGARLPGIGTPTALPRIGTDRALFRGLDDTDADFALKLRAWLDRWADGGTMRGIAREMQQYVRRLPGGDRYTVRVVDRAGVWHVRAGDGSTTTIQPADAAWSWDWDSEIAERAGFWSDLWVIITPAPYALIPYWGTSTTSWGHAIPQSEVAPLREILSSWKAAHSNVRAVIWAPEDDPEGLTTSVMDPTDPTSFRPDGTWGNWSRVEAGVRVRARPDWMRFWEPAA